MRHRLARRWAAHVLALGVALLVLAPDATAQERPCEGIGESVEYNAILVSGSELAKDGKHAEAIAEFEKAQTMCAYDPVVSFYIARAHQLMGECDIAIAMYKQAESQRATGYVDTPLTADKIGEKLEEAVRTCRTRARYEIACADDDVLVEMGESEPIACPLSGETDAGEIRLVATREGFRPHRLEVVLIAGEANTVTIPELVPEGPKTGTLMLNCGEDIGAANVTGANTDVTATCGQATELDPGTYAVEVEDADIREWIDVKRGSEVNLRLQRPPNAATDGTYWIAGWVIAGTGFAAAATGAALMVVARSQIDDIVARRDSGELTQVEALVERDDAKVFNTAGIACVSAGGALLLTGAILLLLDDSTSNEVAPDAAAFVPTVGPDGFSLGYRLTF